MPFAPSLRSDVECTAVPTSAEVGASSAGVVSGVSTAAVSLPSGVSAGSGGRSCSSPHQPPRAMVQRMNNSGGGRDGTSAAPHGYNTSTSATTTASDVPPPSPTPLLSSSPGGHAPATRGSSDVKTPSAAFPALHRAPASRGSVTPRDIGAPASTSASSSSSTVGLPPLLPRRASSSIADSSRDVGGSSNKLRRGWSSRDRLSSTSSPIGTNAAAPPLPPLSVTTAEQNPAIGAEAATVSITSGLPHVDTSSSNSGSPSNGQCESYFRDNNIPSLFNAMSEALLNVQPEDPVSFMKEWLQRRRKATSQ